MFTGEALGNRFVIEAEAASGGMATVYRAWDLAVGAPVAVKVLHAQGFVEAERLVREAGLLAELEHPGIVRYVAHGRTQLGAPYLAMEWLDGETLASRFTDARQTGARMPIADVVRLAVRVAQALAVAHRRSVVHRDIKPGNIFLPGGDIDRAKIVDFGIARHTRDERELTQTGALIGTPGYMAPEQARGSDEVAPCADIFALGCVLYECLTGQPAFVGELMLAVLAKILLEDVPRASELRPDTPPRLDALVARMLAKEPEQRPADACALVEELDELWGEISGGAATPAPPPPPRALGRAEQRVLCVLLVQDALTRLPEGEAPTVRMRDLPPPESALRAAVNPFGGRLEPVVDGSIAIIVGGGGGGGGGGSATDQAAQAARCALSLRRLLPEAPVAVATGRAVVNVRLPVGEVIDAASRMLAAKRGVRINLDETTAGLLDSRFDVAGDAGGLFLRGELAEEGTRTVLGKPTPCVGREREIDRLVATFAHVTEERVARAVLLTAVAGAGKSRVRYELVQRVRERWPETVVVLGRGESLAAGAPFGMLAPAMRRLSGIIDGEPLAVRRRRLRARLGRNLAPAAGAGVCDFLGELVGVPFPDDQSDALRAARRDPKLMGDAMRGAWEEWLGAETAAATVLIVLEDLHWGDLPSVQLIDAALRNLADRPLMVLALARPDVHQSFPRLWAERPLEHIRLTPLLRRAAERLVREALGAAVPAEQVARIIDLADGNPFYLEEIIRAVGAGATELPVTVIGMVQARLEGLSEESRRVLRAASVFGERFWRGGVAALVGERTVGLDGFIDELAERELIVRHAAATLPGERELTFRHALVREAAYASLTTPDRALGHRLAGAWLERTATAGDGDEANARAFAMALAQHHDLGGDPASAARWYGRGAEHALAGDDLASAIARAERAVGCGARGAELGALRLIQAEAHAWRGERAEAARRAEAACAELAPGGAAWFRAAAEAIEAWCLQGAIDRATELARAASAAAAADGAIDAAIGCLSRAALVLLFAGSQAIVKELDRLIDALLEDPRAPGRRITGRVRELRALEAYYGGDPEGNLVGLEAAVAAYEAAGDGRGACQALAYTGFALVELGAYDAAEEALRQALAQSQRMGLPHVVAVAQKNLGLVHAARGALPEAQRLEREAAALFQTLGVPRMEGAARRSLATVHWLAGDALAAESEARRAIDLLGAALPKRMGGYAVLARALLLQGRVADALAAARAAVALYREIRLADECHTLVPLVHAEVLVAAGLHAEARDVVLAAREALLERAGRITDESLRRTFLEVADNARTLALARVALRRAGSQAI